MRNLTIKRDQCFAGRLAKMKVYIEDPAAGEITINDVPCRKLGTLKNGEEKTFEIDETAAKVFVIADQFSKSFCSDYYSIPEGGEDVFLIGSNTFNPATGNAFRFYNNNSEGVAKARRKGFLTGLLAFFIPVIAVIAVAAIVSPALGKNHNPEKKTFSAEGMNIVLTDEFIKTDIAQNFTAAYGSEHVGVFVLKEAFSLAEGLSDLTLEQYGDLVIQNNSLSSSKLQSDGDLTFFDYVSTDPETNDTYHYYSYTFKSSDAFWLIQFAVLEADTAEYQPKISEWAHSISFDD